MVTYDRQVVALLVELGERLIEGPGDELPGGQRGSKLGWYIGATIVA